MDQQRLRNLVFEKTGVKVDSDDPIFALVALNEVVLAEAVERHVALIDAATQELALQARAFGSGGAGPAMPLELKPTPMLPLPQFLTARDVRLLACGAAIAIVSGLVMLAGLALIFKP